MSSNPYNESQKLKILLEFQRIYFGIFLVEKYQFFAIFSTKKFQKIKNFLIEVKFEPPHLHFYICKLNRFPLIRLDRSLFARIRQNETIMTPLGELESDKISEFERPSSDPLAFHIINKI